MTDANPVPRKTRWLVPLVVSLLLSPTFASASSPTTISGTGIIYCEISTADDTHVSCNRPSETNFQPAVVPPGNYSSVSITVSWTSYYPEAELMKIDIYVNPNFLKRSENYDPEPNCGNLLEKKEDCFKHTIQGRSPLTLTLNDTSIQNQYIVADVSVADVCGRGDSVLPCDPVPFRQVTDHNFDWTWTLE